MTVGQGVQSGQVQEVTPLERDRRTLKEILIIGVIFGLTLNLISDFISSFPLLLSDPFHFTWMIGWFSISGVATVFLLIRLSTQYLGDESKIDHEIRISIIWDVQNGCIASRQTGYRPQLDAMEFDRNINEEQRALITDALSKGIESFQETNLPIFVAESVLVDFLIRRSRVTDWMLKDSVGSLIPEDNFLLPEISRRESIGFPGKGSIDYDRHSNRESELVLKWKKGYKGSLRMRITLDRVAWFEEKPDRQIAMSAGIPELAQLISEIGKLAHKADPKYIPEFPELTLAEEKPTGFIKTDFIVSFEGRFSPIRLLFGWSRIEELIRWTKGFIESNLAGLDWYFYLKMIQAVKQY